VQQTKIPDIELPSLVVAALPSRADSIWKLRVAAGAMRHFCRGSDVEYHSQPFLGTGVACNTVAHRAATVIIAA